MIEKILKDWKKRVGNNLNYKNTDHLFELGSMLTEQGWDSETIGILIENLKEIDIVRKKQTDGSFGSAYTVKKHNPDRGQQLVKKDASPEDLDKVDKGEPIDTDKTETNIISGDLSKGDNQVKSDMFKYGYKNYQKNTGSKPAPGGAGSAFNEIVSGEGVQMLHKNPNMTEEELAREMYKKTKDSELGKEQKKTPGVGKIPEDIENKELYSKCIVSARSAIKKRENSLKRIKGLQDENKFGKPKKPETFYGAKDSIDAQVRMVEGANNVYLPNGQKVKKEDVIEFIKAGGGGMNPSDTATFIEDEDGNLLVQFHSDKTTTADIQDNSTLIKEGENYKSYLDKMEISDEKKTKAKQIVDDISNQITDIEENYNEQATPIAKRLLELSTEDQIKIIENDKGTLKKNIDVAIYGAKAYESGNTTKVGKKYSDYLPDGVEPKDLTTEQKLDMIKRMVADGNGKGDDTKVINKIGLALQKQDPSIDGIDVKKNLSSQREQVVKLQRERIKKLNEIDDNLGQKMEANEAERAFHLSMLDYPPKKYEEDNPNSIMGAALDVNMGGTEVNGDVLRNCLSVENSKEFKEKFRLVEEEKITTDAQGNVTGKVVFIYALGEGDKRIDIGNKTYRSKAGAAGKTNNTMAYSSGMQKCFKTGEKP